jgi:transcriptional regulator with XRE-family HTH domain
MKTIDKSSEGLLKALRSAIKEKGFTQEAIASRLGITPSVLSKQLRGVESMPPERTREIVDLLGLTEDEVNQMNAKIIGQMNLTENPAWIGMCHKTVDWIGEDGSLLYMLMYWKALTQEQKDELLKIASSRAKSQTPSAPPLPQAAETPAPGGKKGKG